MAELHRHPSSDQFGASRAAPRCALGNAHPRHPNACRAALNGSLTLTPKRPCGADPPHHRLLAANRRHQTPLIAPGQPSGKHWLLLLSSKLSRDKHRWPTSPMHISSSSSPWTLSLPRERVFTSARCFRCVAGAKLRKLRVLDVPLPQHLTRGRALPAHFSPLRAFGHAPW